jgi:NACHT C-terminal Alpha/Beta 2
VRDDFPRQTITEIAKGVGYRCSNPECSRPTVGANATQDGVITIGVAAHICAASPGGPRYNAAQTREARRRKENGIWLCQNCGRLIDADPQNFTVEILIGWKRDAQERAFRELVAPGVPAPTEEAARVRSIIAFDNASAADADFDKLFAKVRAAAGTDLAAYRRGAIWSGNSVELTLRLYDDESAPPFSISKLPLAVEVAPEVTIVAPPGTGKTTTLLQLAGHVLTANSIVPLYFRLGDWAAGSSSLLASLQQRSAFGDVSQGDLLRLAQRGRVLLLLDGWNELDPAAQRKLRVELDQIRHDCPYVRIVATTRRQMLDVGTSGPRIAIEPLSEDQEMAIAHAQFGAAGEKVVDDAWRTAGVRELIATPLYLSALLSGGSQPSSPTTKEALLRLFVQEHERASDHAEALQATLFGCHAEVLTALASHLNVIGSTTMTEADARRIVTKTLAHLRQQGQIVAQPEPLTVLEVLTSHHTLMRSGAGNGAIAFQHQQFQEWYAGLEVAELMRASSRGDAGARVRLRATVLDQPAWEESILFAVERVSRENSGAAVVARAIGLALPIDPMLAAEMIYRSSPGVWEIVKADILAFANRWHHPGTVDRAVRFMIMTGRSEFASHVWPLASNADSQIQLPALRTAPRFRPSVLGPDLHSKIAELPEPTREHLLALIASESGVDGMDLATELAKTDPSPKVQAEVIQYLQFRRADRHVASLLAQAHDKTWALVAERGYADEIRDPATAARLLRVRDRILAQATDPVKRLHLLLDQPPDYPGRDAGITAAIADARFPVRDQHSGTSFYYAHERAPAAVLQGLRQRLEAGLELPFHAIDFLDQLDVTDEGPIAAAILDVSTDNRDAIAISIMAGPRTVAALLDKSLACAEALKARRNDRGLSEEYYRLRSRIAATRVTYFVEAIMARANTEDPDLIACLASLVFLHGDRDDQHLPMRVDLTLKPQLVGILRRWVEVVISTPKGERYHLNEVSNAVGRFGFRELIPEVKRLLDEDLTRLEKARDGIMDARRRGDIRATSDASMLYGNQYREAFSRLGGDEAAAVAAEYLEDRVFGVDASLILQAISNKQLNLPEPRVYSQWSRFDEVAASRAHRAASSEREPANALAVPIFAAIDRLARPETDKDGQLLAIQLARIALAMPHSDQDVLIARVMALPQPLKSKRDLLAAIALDGQVLDVVVVMQGVNEWLEEALRAPWQKRQQTWEIEPWLELLPFTNRPDAVIEALSKVKGFYGHQYRQRFAQVLTAAAGVPGAEGEALLADLARAHKDIASDFEWMKVILGRDSATAVLMYVDLVVEGVFGQGRDGASAWQIGRELAVYVRKFPHLKAELKKRYQAIGAGPAQAMLERVFGELGSDEDLIAMVERYAARRRAYDGHMAEAVRAVALRHEPVQDSYNSFYIHPASVSQVRKFLFSLLRGTKQEAALAKSCLTAIDVLRDQHGIAANDTRHPDVMSEIPWPSEAG